jgi:hypothetical protein
VSTRVTFWLCDVPPLVPVMVMVNVPVGPFLSVVIVNTDVPAPLVTGFGLNEAEDLFGSPLTLRLTLPEKPLVELTLMV